MHGIENVTQAEPSVMPAFAEVEEVANHVDDSYSSLKARADGVIVAAGRSGCRISALSRRTI